MNRNLYLNVTVTLLLLFLIASVILFIQALDQMRFAVEDVKKTLQQYPGTSSVQKEIIYTERKPSDTAVPPSSEAAEIANKDHYDRNAQPGGRLISAFSSDVGNMNYLINNDAYVSRIYAKVNDTLAERDYRDAGSGQYKPKMAHSWKSSKDKLRWRIRLRKGILWHDFTDPVTGREWKMREVTAHDFKFYVDTVKDPSVDASPLRSYLADLDRIEVFDDYEFDVIWKKPYFLSEDITLSLSPLPRHLYHAYDGPFDGKKFNDDHKRNRIIAGCGPYRFEKWEKGKRIVLRRNENYYGKKLGLMPPLEVIAFDIIQHPNTRLQSLLSGDLDIDNLTADQWVNRTNTAEFAPGGSLKKLQYAAFSYNYIGLNQKFPIFRDKKVRQALSYLIDRKKILKDVFFDLADTVTGPFSPNSDACNPALAPYPFSIEKAKQILAEQGWKDADNDGILEKDGKKLAFTVIFPGSSTTYRKMLPVIKEDMAKAGVRMDLLGIEWSVLVKRVEDKSFEACALGWTGTLKPDPFQLWHSSQAAIPSSSNHCSYVSKEADQLIEKIRLTFDGKERTRLYHKFHSLLYEDAPYIFLFAPRNLTVIHNRYQNVKVFRDFLATDLLWVQGSHQKKLP